MTLTQPIPDHAGTLDDARAQIRAEARAVAHVATQIDDSFGECVELLAACTGKVVVIGSGTSGAIARRLAHLLSVCGTPAFYLSPLDGLHGSLGAVAAGDIVVAISKGGESAELVDFVRRAAARGASSVALTGAFGAPLAEAVDLAIRIDSAQADPGNVIAMGSTLATAAWGDALAIALMQRKGYSWEAMLHTHPGGAVGKHAEQLLDAVKKGLSGSQEPSAG